MVLNIVSTKAFENGNVNIKFIAVCNIYYKQNYTKLICKLTNRRTVGNFAKKIEIKFELAIKNL